MTFSTIKRTTPSSTAAKSIAGLWVYLCLCLYAVAVDAVTLTNVFSNDTTPFVTGTGTIGETVNITVNSVLYVATVDASGNWTTTTPLLVLTEGTYAVSVVGSLSGTISIADGVIIDLTAPVITVVSQIANTVTPTITGTVSDVGSGSGIGTLAVVVGGVTYTLAAGAVTVDSGAGTWSLSVPTALPNATYVVTATVVDRAGNSTTDSTSDELLVDSINPTISVQTQLTNSTTPTIVGVVVDGLSGIQSLTVRVNDVIYTLGTDFSIVDVGTGTWNLILPSTADGVYTVLATALDNAGNTSVDGSTNELTVDATKPTISVQSLTTNDETPVIGGSVHDVLSGVKDITVIVGGNSYTTLSGVTIDAGAQTWAFTVPVALGTGTFPVTAIATDFASNETTDATTDELFVEKQSPIVSVVSQVTTDSTPSIVGSVTDAQSGVASVSVDIVGSVSTVSYTLASSELSLDGGTGPGWTLNVATVLAEGTYSLTVTAVDVAGNSITDATTNELQIDTTAPVLSVIMDATNDTTPTIRGHARDTEATASGVTALRIEIVGQAVYVLGDTELVYNSGTGEWIVNVPSAAALADGTYSILASATDAAGNTGTDTTVNELIIDNVLPTVSVQSQASNDSTPVITGTAIDVLSGVDTVSVLVNGQSYTLNTGVTIDGAGVWTLTIPSAHALPSATYAVTVHVLDESGNSVTDATTNELMVDTIPPTVSVNTVTGMDTTPRITGLAADAGTSVGVGDSGVASMSVVVNGQTYTLASPELTRDGVTNIWTLDIANGLADDRYAVTVTVVDVVGNTVTDGTTDELLVDTVPPIITVTNLVTNDTTPVLSGTLSDALSGVDMTSLQVGVNGVTYRSTTSGEVQISGATWTLTIPTAQALADGTYAITAQLSDQAGNVQTDSSSNELRVETVAPLVAVQRLVTPDNTPTLTGTVSDSGVGIASLAVTVAGVTYTLTDIELGISAGQWTLNVATIVPDGTYGVVATAVDAVGNSASDSRNDALIVDTVQPTITVLTSVTNDNTPRISGTIIDAVSGVVTLAVSVDGQTYTLTSGVQIDGTTWNVDIPSVNTIADNTYAVTATAVDAAGNSQTDSSTNELLVDTVLPTVSVVTQATRVNKPMFTGIATDAASGVATLTVRVQGVSYVLNTDAELTLDGVTDIWTLDLSGLSTALVDGVYDIDATLVDGAGNSALDGTSGELSLDSQVLVTSNALRVAISGRLTGAVDQLIIDGQQVLVENSRYRIEVTVPNSGNRELQMIIVGSNGLRQTRKIFISAPRVVPVVGN